jgi:uncharacterized metal-binding protein YceD (DUF177 family)
MLLMPIAPRDDERALNAELQIDLDELQGQGPYFFRHPLSVEWLKTVLEGTDAEVTGAGEVALELSRQGEGAYLLRGELDAKFSVPCARCLDEAVVAVPSELCVTVDRSDGHALPSQAEGDDDEIAEEDGVDRLTFSDTVIDLAEWLAQQVSVAYPIRAFCPRGEACLGLCGSCGKDLNKVAAGQDKPCRCAQELAEAFGAEESPWKQALRKIDSDPS